MVIPTRIKELRESCGMSRDELGDATGFGEWRIQDLETGRVWPSWLDVLAIARVLKVGVKDLRA